MAEHLAADLIEEYETRIAAFERLVGEQALGFGVCKGGSEKRTGAERHAYIRDCRPAVLSVAEGFRLMGIARSTYYGAALSPTDDAAIVEAIAAICEEFECYGWRRVRAALRQQGMFVNRRKINASRASTVCSRETADVISQRLTAIMTSRSSPIGPNR